MPAGHRILGGPIWQGHEPKRCICRQPPEPVAPFPADGGEPKGGMPEKVGYRALFTRGLRAALRDQRPVRSRNPLLDVLAHAFREFGPGGAIATDADMAA